MGERRRRNERGSDGEERERIAAARMRKIWFNVLIKVVTHGFLLVGALWLKNSQLSPILWLFGATNKGVSG